MVVVVPAFILHEETRDIELARLGSAVEGCCCCGQPQDGRTGSKYKSAFKHPKKTCPEGYKAPRSIKRALMKAGAGGGGGVRKERVESECASRELRGREFTTKEFTAKDTAAAVVAMYTFDFGGRRKGCTTRTRTGC